MTGVAPRVLMTTDSVGGVWTYAVHLARALAEVGAAITLVTMGRAPDAVQRGQAASIEGLRLIETSLPLDWLADSPAEVLAAGWAVASLAKRARADIVHLNSPALAACGRIETPLVGVCHSCQATWWRAVREGPAPPDFQWRSDLLRHGLQRCGALIAPSHAFAAATAEAHGILPQVVFNGLTSPPPPAGRRLARVATAGRAWDEGKNIAMLDAAAAALAAPLYVIGPLEGPTGERTVLRHATGLGPRGAFELESFLAQSAIFASAAVYEPFGLAVLEAAKAGCALVLADNPTFRELWEDAALFLPPGDAALWARTLNGLLAEPRAVARLARAASGRAQEYSAERMARGTLAAYAQVSSAFAGLAEREAAA